MIERLLGIGDSIIAGMFIRDWEDRIEACSEVELHHRLQLAKGRLSDILAHEAKHGRFSLLDRSAPEIVSYEREIAYDGRTSIYAGINEFRAA